MDFPLFLYQHRDGVGFIHCNISRTSVMQGGMSDSAVYRKDKH